MTGPQSSCGAGSDLHRVRPRDQRVAERVVDGVEHDDAAAGGAALTGVDERRGDRVLGGQRQVGIVADDQRILAAELEADLREDRRGR